MKIHILTFLGFLLVGHSLLFGQVTPSPAPAQSHPICLQAATIHRGNGLWEVGDILLEQGKITQIGNLKNFPPNTEIINLA
jgi:hypothetical protein